MHRRARLATITALCSASLIACGKSEPAPAPTAAAPAPASEPSPAPPPDPAASAPAADNGASAPAPEAAAPAPDVTAALDVTALTRSEAKLPFKVSVANDPGFRLEPLTQLYALAAKPGQPGFSGPVKDAERARDDDFITAATCPYGQGAPCALGLALPPDAEVKMLRLFLAAGPAYRDYTGAPRPKRLAIHTDAGRAEVDYPDGATDRYIIFAEPVATKGLTIEVLDVYPGKTGELHFSEVEVYGPKGAARPPLAADPATAFVYFETEQWKDKGGGHHTIKMTWLDLFQYQGVGEHPPPRRWIRGLAAYGDKGDRFTLIERGQSSTCDAPEVGYLLIDRETRMIYPLGPLAGGGATIYRHRDGLGFLAAPPGDGEDAVAGIRTIVFDPATKTFERRRGKKTWTLADHLREWQFEERTRRPGGRDLDAFVADPESGCEALPPGEDLAAVIGASKVFSDAEPGEWWSCPLGDGHYAFIGRDRACGEAVSLLLKTPAGELLRRAEFPAGAGPRRVAVEADPAFPGILVEVGKEHGAASDLVPLNIDLHGEPILRDSSLGVRPPAACGACLLEYPNARSAALPSLAPDPEPEPEPEPEPDEAP